ncbi:MAG: HEAT repeat domain-containing protein [Spirochaetales bacterium]|jgi:hypothetical protein|nr:HEAT repeat domain-containing protein [Spirochaetales bacterium]
MDSPFLSPEEKKQGLKYHYRHQIFNGIGYNFLGDTSVILLAIHYGASNTELGYLSSVIYAAGLLLLILPRIFNGFNIVRLQFGLWIFTGALCLAYFALFWTAGRPAVNLILVVYTLFSGLRILGTSFYQPILRMLSTNQSRGKVVGTSSFQYQLAMTFSKFISYLVTAIKGLPGAVGVILLQGVGIVFNTLAGYQLKKIPCREVLRCSPGRNIFILFKESMRNREFRANMILVWLNTAQYVLYGFATVLLRRDAGFSSSEVFLFSITMGLAFMSAAIFTRFFADQIGSRPLALGSNLLLAINSLIWAFTTSKGLLPNLIYGYTSFFFLRSNDLLVSRLIVRTLPEEDPLSYSNMINFFIALAALAAGYIGGKLADLPALLPRFLYANNFTWTFLFSFLICVLHLGICLRVRDQGSLSPQDAALILFSPSNLSTYQHISRLMDEQDSFERNSLLINIGLNASKLATQEIRNSLFTPLSADKGMLINSLYSHPRPILLPELLREASEPYSYHRLRAIFALGAYPGKASEELLLRLLEESNPSVVSNAAKSLGRIGCAAALDRIRLKAGEAREIWDELNFIIALAELDKTGEFLRGVFDEKKAERGSVYNQTLYSLYAQVLKMTPSLSSIFQHRNMKKGQGLRDFLDEARENKKFLASHYDFLVWFREDDYLSIWRRCGDILSGGLALASLEGERPLPPYYRPLRESLLTFPPEKSGYDDCLAAVYFCYQLLTLENP